ncbi:hypothetical protein Asi02nite_14750 [Asanoa siamensis]|uniref:Uncharacterized protein n=2 Tax=Asanoa siamensis TaxID=926357 RepID=A0ABQ4CKX7_9ACTN|nr:hypothetical protein Asi02nite_14750 [Asanoa siamensis]
MSAPGEIWVRTRGTGSSPSAQREPDGRYRHDRRLYKSLFRPRQFDCLDWALGDPATWCDVGWLLFDSGRGRHPLGARRGRRPGAVALRQLRCWTRYYRPG